MSDSIEPYYQDEWATIYHGDCRGLLTDLPKVDLVLTDPPYGIKYATGYGSSSWGDGSIEGDVDTSVRDAVLHCLNGVTKLVFGTWKVQKPKGVRAVIVWDTKGALGMGDLSIPWKPSYQEIYIMGPTHIFTGKRTGDVLRFAPVQSMAKNGRLHPMQKPCGLIKELIQKTTAGLILDPFMGSGTTLRAAKDLNRHAIGIEIEEQYCEIAAKRLQQEVFDFS